MRLRPVLLVIGSLAVLAACTPPPDSPTRGSGPTLEVRLGPTTCLNGRCINYIPATGNVFAPDRITVPIPRGMVGPDGYIGAADFNRLVGIAYSAMHINATRFSM
jgi:hypothetical protein